MIPHVQCNVTEHVFFDTEGQEFMSSIEMHASWPRVLVKCEWLDGERSKNSGNIKVTDLLLHFLRWENASEREHGGKKMECMEANSLGHEILKSTWNIKNLKSNKVGKETNHDSINSKMCNRVDLSFTHCTSCVFNVFKSVSMTVCAQNLLLNTARCFRRCIFSLKNPLEKVACLLTLLLSLLCGWVELNFTKAKYILMLL